MWGGKKKLAFGLIAGVLFGFLIAGHGPSTPTRPERHPPVASRARRTTAVRIPKRTVRKYKVSHVPVRPLCTQKSTLTDIVSHKCVPG